MDIAANVSVFFKGVNDTESLRKRYKALQKIYHPDNMHGDSALITAINEEYEKLKRFYLGT
jgi:curved DNA-binding protein CbpA